MDELTDPAEMTEQMHQQVEEDIKQTYGTMIPRLEDMTSDNTMREFLFAALFECYNKKKTTGEIPPAAGYLTLNGNVFTYTFQVTGVFTPLAGEHAKDN